MSTSADVFENYLSGEVCSPCKSPIANTGGVQWVIVGGESGDNARLMDIRWVYDIKEQCKQTNVPFFFKQSGNWISFTKSTRFSKRYINDYTGEYADDIILLSKESGQEYVEVASKVLVKYGDGTKVALLGGESYHEFPKL